MTLGKGRFSDGPLLLRQKGENSQESRCRAIPGLDPALTPSFGLRVETFSQGFILWLLFNNLKNRKHKKVMKIIMLKPPLLVVKHLDKYLDVC